MPRIARHQLNTLSPKPPGLYVRLCIDPNDSATEDDRFRLFATDRSYEQAKTVRDDLEPDDRFVDLLFTDLKEKLNYSFEIDPGKDGEAYLLFEDVPFEKLNNEFSDEANEGPAEAGGEAEELEDDYEQWTPDKHG